MQNNMIIKKIGGKGVRLLVNRCRKSKIMAQMLLFNKKTVWYCPCCDLKYKSFVSGIYLDHPERYNPDRYKNTQQEVICPYCGSLPRHRILACWCEKNKNILQSSSILYLAPESSMMLWMKREKVRCTTADIVHKADVQLDIQSTGLSDASYDVIIANHVLEHVDDFRKALIEVHRVLKAGGSFICSFPMDPKVELIDEDTEIQSDEERYNHYGQVDHKRVFGMKADQFLIEAGFKVKTIKGEDCPSDILPIVGPADYDMNCLFLCRKE